MIRLYLVTGFLGAGKTTFLKNFVRALSDRRLTLIENEFGKEGVDGKLLSELGIALEEINNGSIFCSCRLDKFEQVLADTIKSCPDTIIVEASGLSDPTNIRKILSENKQFSQIDYMGSICLVDAVSFTKIYHTARVCKKQIGISDIVIINKIDLVSTDKLQEVRNTIMAHRPDMRIFETQFGQINSDWLDELVSPVILSSEKGINTQDITLQKYLIRIKDSFDYESFEKFLQMFIEETYRIKGFVKLGDKVYLVDCVGNLLSVKPYDIAAENCGSIVVLSGNGMPVKKAIDNAAALYCEHIISVE